MGLSLSLVFSLSVGAPLSFATPTQAELERGIGLFENFKDSEAAVVFRRVLTRSPPGSLAAKARLYLGLIAFNAIDPDEAKVQFRHALEANPAAELPRQASPKAKLAFDQVRRDLSKETAAAAEAPAATPWEAAGAMPEAAAPAPVPPVAAPEGVASAEMLTPRFDAAAPAEAPSPAVEATSQSGGLIEVSAPQASPSSHVASYVLIAATAVLTGVAIYGGYEVANYNSMVAAGNNAVGSGSVPYSASQIGSNRGPASFWAVGWPVAACVAAAGVVGAVLTW
jgi:hypothetical protein